MKFLVGFPCYLNILQIVLRFTFVNAMYKLRYSIDITYELLPPLYAREWNNIMQP